MGVRECAFGLCREKDHEKVKREQIVVLILERAFSLLFCHWLQSAVDCVTVPNKQPVNGIPNTVFCWRDTTILIKTKLVTSVKSISVKNI